MYQVNDKFKNELKAIIDILEDDIKISKMKPTDQQNLYVAIIGLKRLYDVLDRQDRAKETEYIGNLK